MKRCNVCGEEKDFSQFHKRGNGYQYLCKACRKEQASRYYRKTVIAHTESARAHNERRLVWARSLKEGSCTDCGGSFHPVAMQWDHVGTDKLANVSRLAQRASKARVLAEIAKCELVCANCHAVRTHLRRIKNNMTQDFSSW